MQDFDMENQLAQQRYQQALAAQQKAGQMPQGKMVGNQYVRAHPMQYLSEMLRSYNVGQEKRGAEKELKDLQGKRREAETRDMSAFVSALRGTPAQPAFEAAGPAPEGAPQDGGYTVPAQAAKPGDPMAAYSLAASSQSPMIRQMGIQGMAQVPQMEAQKQERIDNRAFRAQESELARQARAQELQTRMEDQRASQAERLAAQKEMRQMQMDFQRQNQQLIAANRPERQAQIIDTDQGKMQVLPGGRLAPLMDTQGNAISGPKGPQGTLARENEAKQALAAIKQAETLLPKATSSGLGSAVDATAAFFGASTPGAQAASQLKALEGELVSKMPKMSGPQSDKDVALYKQMAGVIGDQTQPVATRQAALATVKEIQKRYAGQQPMPQPGQLPGPRPQNMPQTGRIRFDANGNIIQ